MANTIFGKSLRRRTLLRGSGVAMALPYLTSMRPAMAKEEPSAPNRFVAFTLGLGLVAENLNPKETGKDYSDSLYLSPLADLKNDFTVISGASHPGVKGGHRAEASILTGTPMGAGGNARNTISIDQLLAKHLGQATRFASLTLSVEGSSSPAYTESGAMIPPIDRPDRLFDLLFTDGSPEERKRRAESVARGRSIMDIVGEDAKALQRELGASDNDRLDEFFTGVRDLEKRMKLSEQWAKRPKPKVDTERVRNVPNRSDFVAKFDAMAKVMRLAFETDSTRFITLHLGGANHTLPREGVNGGYHSLSHHGKDEDKLDQLKIVESALVSSWGDFVRNISSVNEGNARLLDRTSVLLTSNLGNASNHDNRNMPVLFAGGGFQHAGHLAFDQKNNYPLTNLYVSVLQNAGLEFDQFASGQTTFDGLAF